MQVIDLDAVPEKPAPSRRGAAASKAAPQPAPPRELCKAFYRDGGCGARPCSKQHSELALCVRNLPEQAGLNNNEKARRMALLFSAFGPVGAVMTSSSEGCVIFPTAAQLHDGK